MKEATGEAIRGSRKSKRTWVVVADGGQGRILESEATHSGVIVRFEASSGARLTGGKLAADRLPRAQDSAGPTRHGIEPRQSLKQHEKEIFIARLADYLKGGRNNFDQLVLVAPGRMAKALQAALPSSIAAKIIMTRSSDMTWMPVADVLKRLGPIGKEIQRSREGRGV